MWTRDGPGMSRGEMQILGQILGRHSLFCVLKISCGKRPRRRSLLQYVVQCSRWYLAAGDGDDGDHCDHCDAWR